MSIKIVYLTWISLCLSLLLPACGTTPMGTRAIEERYLGMGEANSLYTYANDMLYQGRYREALTAMTAAEQAAYTDSLRSATRARRLWLQEYIAAQEEGQMPPPPPVIDSASNRVADKAIYSDQFEPTFILPPTPAPLPPAGQNSPAHPAAVVGSSQGAISPAHPAAMDLTVKPAPLYRGDFSEKELAPVQPQNQPIN